MCLWTILYGWSDVAEEPSEIESEIEAVTEESAEGKAEMAVDEITPLGI